MLKKTTQLLPLLLMLVTADSHSFGLDDFTKLLPAKQKPSAGLFSNTEIISQEYSLANKRLHDFETRYRSDSEYDEVNIEAEKLLQKTKGYSSDCTKVSSVAAKYKSHGKYASESDIYHLSSTNPESLPAQMEGCKADIAQLNIISDKYKSIRLNATQSRTRQAEEYLEALKANPKNIIGLYGLSLGHQLSKLNVDTKAPRNLNFVLPDLAGTKTTPVLANLPNAFDSIFKTKELTLHAVTHPKTNNRIIEIHATLYVEDPSTSCSEGGIGGLVNALDKKYTPLLKQDDLGQGGGLLHHYQDAAGKTMAFKCVRDDDLHASIKISVHANPLIDEIIDELAKDREMAFKKAKEKGSNVKLTL